MSERDVILKFIQNTEDDLIKNYKRLGLKASGNWEKDLEGSFTERPSGFRITFKGSAYTEQLVNGRRPNKNKDSIRAFVGWAGSTWLKDWVKNKGAKASSYAIAYRIAREGIKVPNSFNSGTLLSDIFTDQRIESLLQDINGSIINNIRSDINASNRN